MKNIITLVLISFSCLISGYSQIRLNVANVAGNKNDTVQVPVTVTGFNNVVLLQYTLNYDSNVLAIVDIIKTANFDVDFATHVGNFFLKNGQLGFIWSSASGFGQNIPNGTTLFTLKFHLKGKECDSSFVKLGNHQSLPNEAQDGNFNDLTLTVGEGKVKINGTGCVGNPPPDTTGLQIFASQEIAPQGTVKCIKVTTRDFKNIQTGQFSMKWDKTVAKFESLTSGAFNLIFGQGYSPLPDSSGVGIVWYSELNPVTLPDDAVLFEVCLKAVGTPGSFTAVTFDGTPAAIEFTDGNGDDVPAKFTAGRFTITDAPALALKLYYRDTTVNEGAEFCIPIRVDNFVCVESFQFGVIFDTTKLKFTRISGINIPNFGAPNYFKIRDSIRFQWDSQGNPPTRNNGDFIFMICFEAIIPNCPFDTKLTFTNLPNNTPMGFTDCNDKDFTVITDAPVFTVACRNANPPIDFKVVTPAGIRCFGDCNGSISRSAPPTGGSGSLRWEWRKYVNGSFVFFSDSLNITRLCGGELYQFCVIDLGNANKDTCETEIEIEGPSAPITCTAVITHAQTGNDGKIDLTTSGGTPPYSWKWKRLSSGSQIAITEDIMNLPANNYEVMITDANGCVKMDTFTVNPPPFEIIDTTYVHNRCHGDCLGSITISARGGRTPYFFNWENGDTKETHDTLCAGTYFVTVTDNSNPKATFVLGPLTITEPDKIDITLDSIRKSSGTNGGIFVTVKGGTPKRVGAGSPYIYTWRRLSPPPAQQVGSTEDLTNLPQGTYSICASDSLNCVQCDTFIVDNVSGPGDTLTVTLDIDEFNGGNAVSCRGKCDARISVLVASRPKENKPYSYKWSHNATLNSNVASNLCPGQSITVTVTDAAGNTAVSSTLIIPDAPTITLAINKLRCATDSVTNDGAYEAVTTGAVSPISYRWCNGTISKTAFDLPDGNCSLEITDANGCTLSQSFSVCRNDVTPNVECYQSRLAISPNNDGLNDVLEIACVTDLGNSLTIFDRWGNIVKFYRNYANEWNGVNEDGEDLVEGTYLWILKIIQSGEPDIYYKGTVTIVR